MKTATIARAQVRKTRNENLFEFILEIRKSHGPNISIVAKNLPSRNAASGRLSMALRNHTQGVDLVEIPNKY